MTNNIKHLVMYEVSQKQQYIFRTNRLLENTGGSYIIRDLTEKPDVLFKELSNKIGKKFKDRHKNIPKATEKIVGGGSAIYIFNSKDDADEFSKTLSANILRYFPGLELFLVRREMDWENEKLYKHEAKKDNGEKPEEYNSVISDMRDLLADKKDRRRQTVFQKSWGIHQACQSTGLPANEFSKPIYSKDKERRAHELVIKEKIGVSTRDEEYEERFIEKNAYLSDSAKKNYKFIEQDDLEDIFAKSESSKDAKSYLSIISLDGNAMGIKVQEFLGQGFNNNENYLTEYEKFTNAIDNAYTLAFQKTIYHVMKDYERWAKTIYGKDIDKYKNIVPIRPVISSGDDVSFISFGQLGLEVARIYLQYLQKESICISNKDCPMNACAGVAIIPHRYPFWIGFQLADSLCDHAKKRLQVDGEAWKKINGESGDYDTSLIDWQLIESGGSIGNITDYRKRYYETKDGSNLTMRPYYIQKQEDKKHFANYQGSFYRAVDVISKTIEKSKKQPEYPGRSKWKELRDVYHRGPKAVDQWVLLNQFFALKIPDDKKVDISDRFFFKFANQKKADLNQDDQTYFRLSNDKIINEGKDHAFYYDALEVYDYFILLSEVEKDESTSRND